MYSQPQQAAVLDRRSCIQTAPGSTAAADSAHHAIIRLGRNRQSGEHDAITSLQHRTRKTQLTNAVICWEQVIGMSQQH